RKKGKPKVDSVLEDKKTEPARTPKPAPTAQQKQKNEHARTGRIIGGVFAIAVLLMGAIAAIAFIPVGDQAAVPGVAETATEAEPAPPLPAPRPEPAIATTDLPGFYVGYTTRADGTREDRTSVV